MEGSGKDEEKKEKMIEEEGVSKKKERKSTKLHVRIIHIRE